MSSVSSTRFSPATQKFYVKKIVMLFFLVKEKITSFPLMGYSYKEEFGCHSKYKTSTTKITNGAVSKDPTSQLIL